MNVKELRGLLKKVPDDIEIRVSNGEGSFDVWGASFDEIYTEGEDDVTREFVIGI